MEVKLGAAEPRLNPRLKTLLEQKLPGRILLTSDLHG